MTERPRWWSSARAEILEHLAEAYPEEGCGLVTFDGECFAFVRCQNVAPPSLRRVAFEIDPRAWMKAEVGVVRVVAIVHSHPEGPAHFSVQDLRDEVKGGMVLHPGVDHCVVAFQCGEADAVGVYRIDDGVIRQTASFSPREPW